MSVKVQFFLNNPSWRPYVYFSATLILIIAINCFIRLGLTIFKKKLSKKSEILHIFYQSINKPLRLLTWTIGLWLVMTQEATWSVPVSNIILEISYLAIKITAVLIVTWALLSFAKEIKSHLIMKNTRTDGGYNDFSVFETGHKAAQFIIILLAGLAILNTLHIPLMALAGMTTIFAGFFAISQQELIKNLFGGMLLYLDRPFSIGDWIYTVGNSIEGTVEKISFRLTIIRGFDKRPIYVPNSTFLSTPVVNASRMSNRRILQYVGLCYRDFSKLPDIMEKIRKMLKTHKDIDQKCIILVAVVNGNTNIGTNIEGFFGSSSINFMIYAFTKTVNWIKFQSIQDDIMNKVGNIILGQNASIAFPTKTIDINSEFLSAIKDITINGSVAGSVADSPHR